MFALVGVAAVVIPILELIFIAVMADWIGLVPTALLLVGLTLAGLWLFVHQGITTWRRLRTTMRRREMPSDELADAALLMVGGLLLLTPGFLTDVAALLFIVPGPRGSMRKVARRFLGWIAMSRFGWVGTGGSVAKRVYDARVTKVRREEPVTASLPGGPPERLPSPGRRDDVDGSPDRG